MESWDGKHVSKLIKGWGPPQQVVPDGRGGKIYIWSRHVKIPLSKGSTQKRGTISKIGDTYYYEETAKKRPPQDIEYDRVRMFWVNCQGIIYHWRWKGF